MNITILKTDLKETVNGMADKLKDSFSFLKDMKEASLEKINTLVNDILGLAPLIEVTGSNMKEVSVDVGIPPGISISFIKEKDVDAETIHQLLEDNKDKEILKLIIRGLQKADSIQKGMNLAHYIFRGLNMKIGLPPDMSLKFVRGEAGRVKEKALGAK
jgi:hypothetical protein